MNKRGLLNFGLDHLTINFKFCNKAEAEQVQSTNIYYLARFLKYNKLDAASTDLIAPLFFEPFNQEISIRTQKNPNEHLTFKIDWGPHNIMQFEIVDSDSLLKKNLYYKYNYRITFHGKFFALDRIGKIKKEDFLKPFLDDINNDFTKHSVSRVDICADIFGTSVSAIWKSIRGEKSHRKKHTPIAIDPVTSEPETINYSSKKKNNWYAKIYNKLLEVIKHEKESLYLDYFEHQKVTRFEITLKTPEVSKFGIDLTNIGDLNFLLSVYRQILSNKYTQFRIVNFVVSEMEKRGFKPFHIKPKDLEHDRLLNVQVYKRAFKNLVKLIEEYDITYEQLMKELENLKNYKSKLPYVPLLRDDPNQKI